MSAPSSVCYFAFILLGMSPKEMWIVKQWCLGGFFLQYQDLHRQTLVQKKVSGHANACLPFSVMNEVSMAEHEVRHANAQDGIQL